HGRAAERPVHPWIAVLIWRPSGPIVKVVDERKDFLRRRVDGGAALHMQRIRTRHSDQEHRGNRNDDDDENDFDHTRSSLTGRTSTLPTRAGGILEAA